MMVASNAVTDKNKYVVGAAHKTVFCVWRVKEAGW